MTSIPDSTASVALSDKPYPSLTALRQHHLELKQTALEALQDSKKAAEATQSVRAFISRAAASGNLIGDENQRKSAQAIIDYWTTELASSPDAKDIDYAPAVLAPFDGKIAAPAGSDPQASVPNERARPAADGTLAAVDETKAASIEASKNLTQDQKQTREMIRLAATARLWRDAGKEPGFLLVGRAIDWADQYRDKDPDIAHLVDESRRAVRRWWRNLAIVSVLTAGLAITGVGYLYFEIIPGFARSELRVLSDIASGPARKEQGLWRVSRYERFMPVGEIQNLYLTSLQGLDGIDLGGIQLYSAGFTNSSFPKVNFQKAELQSSSFADTTIEGSQFNDANLSYAQFDKAAIDSASFYRTTLYRASFDEAQLSDVDFSEAYLLGTSFRNVTMDDESVQHFKNTAWWLAFGWNADNFGRLSALDQTSIGKSRTFVEKIQPAKDRVAAAGAGTFERAVALNFLAWTRATWGVDIEKAASDSDLSAANCENNKNIPESALAAASEAVCIARRLKQEAATKGDTDAIDMELANFEDTLGYVLLQTEHTPDAVPKALRILEEAMTISNEDDDRQTMFHYSVAQYASDPMDQAALRTLKASMIEKRYMPSHELWLLRRYLTNTEFLACVYGYQNREPGLAHPRCP